IFHPECARHGRAALVPYNKMNRLQQRFFDYMEKYGRSVSAGCADMGLAYAATIRWLKEPSRTMKREAITKMAECFGIPLEQAIVEAGGRTAEELWKEQGDSYRDSMPRMFVDRESGEVRSVAEAGGRAHRGRAKPESFRATMAQHFEAGK